MEMESQRRCKRSHKDRDGMGMESHLIRMATCLSVSAHECRVHRGVWHHALPMQPLEHCLCCLNVARAAARIHECRKHIRVRPEAQSLEE